MNRDDIIRMAREAWDRDEDLWLTSEQYFLERFAALVATAEREACAKLIEEMDVQHPKYIAAAIRARGET